MSRPGPRDRLLLATIDLVREHGVRGTGLAEVLTRSGTARASVYHHFPRGKDQLVAESVRTAGTHVLDLMAGATTARGKLEALLDWWSQQVTEAIASGAAAPGCPVAAASVAADPEVRAAAADAFERWCDDIAACLVDGPPHEARRLAGLAVSVVEGAILRSRARGDAEPLDEARRLLPSLLG
ncbi:TetR/AcrR family transcriptional regulator [Aeromicrobium sp. CF4.19]|uniref:TetR/AcrR family transcriptional regulator n=1 Tax=Aeromicrobium sp. CF4.19 TaxID=3373082 RepID=UPI003EE45AA2